MAAARKSPPELEIHRVDTEPPPPGEDSAYDAPTKVGVMSHAAIDKLMREAELPSPASGLRPSEGARALYDYASDDPSEFDPTKVDDSMHPRPVTSLAPAPRPPAFPEWTHAASRYEPPAPRLSDRALAVRIAAGALGTLAALAALLWWLFQ